MTTVTLPTPQEIAQFLGRVVSREITAAPAPFPEEGRSYSAFFDDAEGRLAGLLMFDVEAAARLGAALTMIPAGGADEAVVTGCLDEGLTENLHEICNICVAFLDQGSSPLALRAVVSPHEESMSAAAAAASMDGAARVDIRLNIGGYGGGHVMVIAGGEGADPVEEVAAG